MIYAQSTLFESEPPAEVDPLDRCPVLKGKPHHSIKVPGDTSWWCAGCGVAGLPAPDRPSWEGGPGA